MSAIERRIRKILPDWVIILGWVRKYHVQVHPFRPRTFNDKVVHRLMFDRRPILAQVTDKVQARSFAEKRLGPAILPKLYQLTDQPETIRFDSLPERFVVKPTHASGWARIVMDKSTLDRADLIATCKAWLNRSYYEEWGAWIYKKIVPQIMVEEFIDDGNRPAPNDYKLHTFNGVVHIVQVDQGRFEKHRRRLFSRSFERLNFLWERDDITGEVPRPPHLDEMVAAAETLGQGFDYIRVDFYDTPERLLFGELSATPGAGMERFFPESFDLQYGELWKLP